MGNNRFGSAGKGGVPAATVVAFLDHYTYEGRDPTGQRGDLSRLSVQKRINGRPIDSTAQRSIRRWRNGQVDRVSTRGLVHVLDEFGFTMPWFHGWCKLHRKPIT